MHISGDTKFVNPRRESLLRNAGHNLWAHAYSHWMLVRSETLGCRDNTVHHDQLGEMRSDRGEIFGTPKPDSVERLPYAVDTKFGTGVGQYNTHHGQGLVRPFRQLDWLHGELGKSDRRGGLLRLGLG